ncbi:MAG: hypothetical protein IJW23_04195 [Lentisphaeria bacterium]|nr:hypothetical protein [Lentisphaeria bacterium]
MENDDKTTVTEPEAAVENAAAQDNHEVSGSAPDGATVSNTDSAPEQKKVPDFFKRHKKLCTVLGCIVLGLLLLRLLLSPIIVWGVNSFASGIAGIPVKLGDIELGLLSGYVCIQDLKIGDSKDLNTDHLAKIQRIELHLWSGNVNVSGISAANPKGFQDKEMLTLKQIAVNLNISSLSKETIVINKILVDGLDFYFEPSSAGKNNVEMLVDHVTKLFPASEKKEEPGEPKQVQIGHISLKNIVLHARMPKELSALNEGIAITLTEIDVFQQRGEAEIKNIIISNPAGFFEENILTLKRIKAAVDLNTLGKKKITIRQFLVDGLDFYFEPEATGNSNVGRLQDYIKIAFKTPDSSTPEDETNSETKVQLDDLSLTNINVHTVVLKQKLTLPVLDIEQKDLGTSQEGITGSEIFIIALDELTNGSLLAIGKHAKKFGMDLKLNATKTFEEGSKSIKDQFNSLRSLF